MIFRREDEMLIWQKEPPTEEGWYWIYVKSEWGKLELWCVRISIMNGNLSFCFPVSGYEWEEDIEPENVLYWLGPIEKPNLPKEIE